MNQSIFQIALLVKDYDEALDFYLNKLHFQLMENTVIGPTKRWLVIKPKGENSCSILLTKAKNEKEVFCVGNQSGGRVFLFLYTDDLLRDYKNLQDFGVAIIRKPKEESFGKVLVFADLYGNLWDLIQKN